MSDLLPSWRTLADQIAQQFQHYQTLAGSTDDPDRHEDQQRLQRAIALLIDQLAQAEDSTTHLRDLRHEVRNHVGAIRGYSELLQEEYELPAGAEAALQAILSSCHTLIDSTNLAPHSTPQTLHSRLPSSEPGQLLVVDDNDASRQLLRRYLEQAGHQVIEASSGREALQQLGSKAIDLVLLDLVMPEMDGLNVLQQIKQHPDWRRLPVVVISGEQETEPVIQCIEAGAEDFLFKPFNPVLLSARIRAGLERKRWLDREQAYRFELERSQRFIRQVFGRYLSEEIVEALLEEPSGLNLGGDTRQVTVMMADIRGFTPLAEQLPPERVVRLLNVYLGHMSEIIIQHRGTIDEFLGDGILAIFGAPVQHPDDADQALACALAMQATVPLINQELQQQGLPTIDIGIALNTGKVVAGNIGSRRRTKYGVVGHTVNVTARIESTCAAGELLIADATLNALRVPPRLQASRQLQAKGVGQPLTVHSVQPPSANES